MSNIENQAFIENVVNNEDINYEFDYFPHTINNQNVNNEDYYAFSDENIVCDKDVIDYFVKEIVPLKDKFNGYNFAVTGPIASGKSTILESLNILFNMAKFRINVVPEYIGIDKELGGKLLVRRITNNISNTTFQNYVMDQYKNKLEANAKRPCDICLFERLPDDSILCFSNISNFDNIDLTNFDLFVLDKRMKAINEKYGIPTYRNESVEFEIFSTAELKPLLLTVIGLIKHDIERGVKNRIIGLDISTNLTLTRLKRRARPGEDKYDVEYLNRIVRFYKKLYKTMLSNRTLLNKFTCIGTLLIDNN